MHSTIERTTDSMGAILAFHYRVHRQLVVRSACVFRARVVVVLSLLTLVLGGCEGAKDAAHSDQPACMDSGGTVVHAERGCLGHDDRVILMYAMTELPARVVSRIPLADVSELSAFVIVIRKPDASAAGSR
ncbi:MAG: hypothetical protein EOO28_17880 [Comamonadaceae bacterium]|nr:MAG: hypothetical protein EOO28_17880 [Comamonadaceae bacterium]